MRFRQDRMCPGACAGAAVLVAMAWDGTARAASDSVAVVAAPTRGGAPGVVLHEVHTQPHVPRADTIVTYVTSRSVRVSHTGGHTLLDLGADRIVFLDPVARTYRDMPLQQWEARLEAAVIPGAAPGAENAAAAESVGIAPTAGFEPVGTGAEIAGYTCDRYHHYGMRNLLGAEESVEQQVWVARRLEMPAGAYEAYQRALGSIESIGAGALLRRPPGIILAVETRTQRAGSRRSEALEIETTTVFRIEHGTIADSIFAIPRGYLPASARELPRPDEH